MLFHSRINFFLKFFDTVLPVAHAWTCHSLSFLTVSSELGLQACATPG